MMTMNPEVRQPSTCSDAELAAFCCFVRRGDEVMSEGLEERVQQRGLALVFLWVDHALVGVGGLKRPNTRHRDKVFRSAGVPKEASRFSVELGWIFIPKEHRGKRYSLPIAATAMSQADGAAVFATTRSDNVPMQHTLDHLGFTRLGEAWASERGDYKLVLHVTSRPATQ